MTNFGLITWDYCKNHLEMDTRDKELTELLIFSASAEIEIYTETKLVDPEYYSCNIPSIDGSTETSSEIILVDDYSFPKGRNAIQIIYRTGYKQEEMPENLKRACLELVDWNLKRMRGDNLEKKDR